MINLVRMLLLESQEKTAIAILILVTGVCLGGTILLDGMGKERFSQEYAAGMADGALVSWEGVIGSMHTVAVGSVILEVSGVSVFLPVSAGILPDVREWSLVRMIGTVQHWTGKEEILIEAGSDIGLIS